MDMQFQTIIYKIQEIEEKQGRPLGWEHLDNELKEHGILVCRGKDGLLYDILKEYSLKPESVLAIAATDETLKEAAQYNLAVLAYRNPHFPNEELFWSDFLIESFDDIDYYFLERVYQRKHGIPWTVIETRRCYLREMTVSDLPDLYELYSGAGMTDYIQPLRSFEEEVRYVKTYLDQMYRFYGYGFWFVKDRFTDELIGRAGFENYLTDDIWALEMGYAITPGRQRQGYAFEICKAMLAYAKGIESGFEKVYCFVKKSNAASIALLVKLGFLFEGMQIYGGENMLRYVYLLED